MKKQRRSSPTTSPRLAAQLRQQSKLVPHPPRAALAPVPPPKPTQPSAPSAPTGPTCPRRRYSNQLQSRDARVPPGSSGTTDKWLESGDKPLPTDAASKRTALVSYLTGPCWGLLVEITNETRKTKKQIQNKTNKDIRVITLMSFY